jgi:hypothetical protein
MINNIKEKIVPFNNFVSAIKNTNEERTALLRETNYKVNKKITVNKFTKKHGKT